MMRRSWIVAVVALGLTLVLAQTGLAAEAHGEAAAAKPSPFPSVSQGLVTALTTLVVFVLLLVVLHRTAWQGVLAGLKSREERIRKEIADAEAARAKADATLRDYNARLATAESQVKDMLARATADGERIAADLRVRSQQEAEEIKERANRDIETAKNQAVAEIYERAADLSTSVAEKILRRNLNAADQRDLINSSLEQLQTVNKG